MFPKLQIPKNVVKYLPKNFDFRGPFNKHDNVDKTLLESELHHLNHIYRSLWRQLSWKNPLLIICQFLRLFLHTLTADYKYSLINRDNLREPIQMQLSQKHKKFSKFVYTYLKRSPNFEIFQKNDEPRSWWISKTTDSQKLCWKNL